MARRGDGIYLRSKTCCDPSRANRRGVDALADVLGRKLQRRMANLLAGRE
jgi:hypothetical protein